MARFRLCAQSAADVGEDVVDLSADNGKDDDDHDGDEDEDKRLLQLHPFSRKKRNAACG
jgi:hypothetical protein